MGLLQEPHPADIAPERAAAVLARISPDQPALLRLQGDELDAADAAVAALVTAVDLADLALLRVHAGDRACRKTHHDAVLFLGDGEGTRIRGEDAVARCRSAVEGHV